MFEPADLLADLLELCLMLVQRLLADHAPAAARVDDSVSALVAHSGLDRLQARMLFWGSVLPDSSHRVPNDGFAKAAFARLVQLLFRDSQVQRKVVTQQQLKLLGCSLLQKRH